MTNPGALEHPKAAHGDFNTLSKRPAPRLGSLGPQGGPHHPAAPSTSRQLGTPALPEAALERIVAQCLAGSTRYNVSNAVLVWTPRSRAKPVDPAPADAPPAVHYLRCGGLPHGAISSGAGDALDTLQKASAPHLLRLDDDGATAAASPIAQAFSESTALYLGDLKALIEFQLRCVALAEAVLAGGRTLIAVPLWNPKTPNDGAKNVTNGHPQPLAVLQLVLSAAHVPRRELLALVRSAAVATGLACPDTIASWDPQHPAPPIVLNAQPAVAAPELHRPAVKEELRAAAAKRTAIAAALRAAALPPTQRPGAQLKVKKPAHHSPVALHPAHPPGAPSARHAPASSAVANTDTLMPSTVELNVVDEDLGEASVGRDAGRTADEAEGVEMEVVASPSSQVLSESLPIATHPDSAKGVPRLGRRPRRGGAASKVPPEIALETLKSHLGMEPGVAAGQLGVSTAVLLRAAKRHGIQRWPRPASAGARRGKSSAGPSTSQRSVKKRDVKMEDADEVDSGEAAAEEPRPTRRTRDPRLR